MKKLILIAAMAMTFFAVSAQTSKIKYQAVVRDNNNRLVTNTAVTADETCATAAGDRGTSAIYALEGYTTGEVISTEPNTNLMEPRCVLPTLHSRMEPGEHTLLCAVFTDAGNRLPEKIPEEVRNLAGTL